MDDFIFFLAFPLIVGHFKSIVELKKIHRRFSSILFLQYFKDGCSIRDSSCNLYVSSDLILANSKVCCRA